MHPSLGTPTQPTGSSRLRPDYGQRQVWFSTKARLGARGGHCPRKGPKNMHDNDHVHGLA